MDALLLVLERCGGCDGLFSICRPCYHGQTYCDKSCRVPARAAQTRAARATYQRSAHGRRARRDRNRRLRRRAVPITFVMDQGAELLAPTSSVCLPQGPHAPMSGGVEIEGRSQDDDIPTEGDFENGSTCDESAGATRRRRCVEGGLAGTLFAATPTSVADAARSDGALAPDAGPRCAVCLRGGVVVSTWPSRRHVAQRRHGALHGRATPSRRRSRAPPAHHRLR